VELTADPAIKELLAELEHRRWCAERRLNGKKGLLPRLFSDYRLHHITIISALQTALEMQFAQAGLEQFANQAGRLIIPRAYPYDSAEQQTLSEQADWVIALLPAGQAVNDLELSEAAPQRQLQRAQVYILERADVILVGEEEQTRQWAEWRQGKALIPVELSSLAPSLRGKREIPRADFIVEPTTQTVHELD